MLLARQPARLLARQPARLLARQPAILVARQPAILVARQSARLPARTASQTSSQTARVSLPSQLRGRDTGDPGVVESDPADLAQRQTEERYTRVIAPPLRPSLSLQCRGHGQRLR